MRVLLFTGKGGVGKTTVAAGTAALAAARGVKTLVLSTDGAHSLADAVTVDAGAPVPAGPGPASTGEPVEVGTGLFVHQVDTRRRVERSWREIQGYLLAVLDAAGVDPIAAEELTVLPGAEEVLALLELRDHASSGRWDLLVVDCAPTAETLRLLALPEALRWYLNRVFPPERRVARALRPVLAAHLRSTGIPAPRDRVFEAVQRLHAELADVRTLLTGAATSIRLVLTPESVVVAEARRTLTSLALHGYQVDAVVANRIFPAEGADAWRSGWIRAQAARLAEIEASFAPLPVYRSPYCPAEPLGVEALAGLAAQLYVNRDPLQAPDRVDLMTVERTSEGFVLSLALPLADRQSLDLARAGDELVVTAGSQRRVLALPSALRRCTVAGAALRQGRLHISFEPDPALWRGP